MLKRFSIKKIILTSVTLVVLLMIYLIPSEKTGEVNLKEKDLEYVYSNDLSPIYLLDSNDYVARTVMNSCKCEGVDLAKDLFQGLVIEGKKDSVIPNGFRSIIPTGTESINANLTDKILTIDFSKEFLEVNEKYEEKMIESIIYTLTSIEGIDKIIIKVEGEVLTKLPNSGKELPSLLDKSYGVNKKYDITSTHDITSYTLYYVNNYNDTNYYVPVTKYVNDNSIDKVKIIVEQLGTTPINDSSLMSYLNINTTLVNYEQNDKQLKLNFDTNIYNNSTEKKISRDVINTIGLTMNDAYGVEEVVFLVDNQEISNFSIKDIE